MLKGVHILLTYACTHECDHCFLYCSPRAQGTFTLGQVRRVLDEAAKIETVTSIYFEGGEPFLYYPIMVEGLRLARDAGFSTGVVSNCYWATDDEDARLWLAPIQDAGIEDLSLSDDAFHHAEGIEGPGRRAARAAEALGLSSASICIEAPSPQPASSPKGAPVVGGGVLFKGRAADRLTEGLPAAPVSTFSACRHEELVSPARVHVDAFGNVHVCQGVSIGNMWETPLATLIKDYDASAHAICGPLSKGGPLELARDHGLDLEGEYVDECHYCFAVRRALIDRYPALLAPRQVYGLEAGDR